MIELPDFARMGNATPEFVDLGFTQEGISVDQRIDRKGSRYAIECTFGPYYGEQARVMVSRLNQGKQEGIRVALPLLHDQGSPGAPVANGETATGKTFPMRGLAPGYFAKEGYWLSIEVSGQHYLHQIATGGRADAGGLLSVTLVSQVRTVIPDGAVVHLAKPMIEGFMIGETTSWPLNVDRVTPISFALREAK